MIAGRDGNHTHWTSLRMAGRPHLQMSHNRRHPLQLPVPTGQTSNNARIRRCVPRCRSAGGVNQPGGPLLLQLLSDTPPQNRRIVCTTFYRGL